MSRTAADLEAQEKKSRENLQDIVVGIVCVAWRIVRATNPPQELKKDAADLADSIYDFDV